MQSPGLLLVVAILSLTACGDDKGDATSDALTTSGGSSSTDAPGSSSSSSSGEPGTGSSGAPTTGTPTTGEPVTTTGEPVTGTDSSGGESSGGTSTTGVSGLSLAADVYPVWNPMVRCDCHNGGAGGLSMGTPEDAYMELVGVPANGSPLSRVEPGSSAASYLWHKLSGTQGDVGSGQQMPIGAPPLEQSTIDLIAQWIDEGANP